MRADRSRDQRGELLIESIASLLIISTVVLAGLFMLATTIKVVMTHQGIVRTSNEAVIASEFVQTVPYVRCEKSGSVSTPTAADYMTEMTGGTAPYVNPDGLTMTLTVTAVRYLSPAPPPPDPDSATAKFVPDCPAGVGDQGVQQFTVRVEGEGGAGPVKADLTFLKRDDSCGGLPTAVEGQTC